MSLLTPNRRFIAILRQRDETMFVMDLSQDCGYFVANR